MKTTIKDIAKMAGVSIATVSRVVNNSKPVNEDVRKRVLDVMKQTNYRSGMVPADLAKTESCLIGVIMPQYSNTVLDDCIVGINNVAKLYGYDIMIGLTDGTFENELHYLNRFCAIQTQGIIFVGSPLEEPHVRIIEKSGTPLILIGQVSHIPEIPSVHVDNVMASYEAVTYLIQKGHRQIGMIRGSGTMAVGGDRFEGYCRALADANIPLNDSWVVESEFSVEDGEKAMRAIAESGSMPTAVFCSTDWMAIGAMNFLIDNGFRVPEDVSVFGFDGSFMSGIVRPKLSTVEYSATEIGMTATRNLIKMIKGERGLPSHSNVTHYLSIRDSTN